MLKLFTRPWMASTTAHGTSRHALHYLRPIISMSPSWPEKKLIEDLSELGRRDTGVHCQRPEFSEHTDTCYQIGIEDRSCTQRSPTKCAAASPEGTAVLACVHGQELLGRQDGTIA